MFRRFMSLVFIMLALLGFLYSCADDSAAPDTDDQDDNTDNCQSNEDCDSSTTNMTCNVLEGLCIDQGRCTSDIECFQYYGMARSECSAAGLCLSAVPDGDNSSTDGDAPVVTDGDVPVDGDTDGDITTDGDSPDQTDGDEIQSDGDWDIPPADGDDDNTPDFDPDLTMTNCDNNSGLSTPQINVDPNVADFGAVPMGDYKEVVIWACNGGGVNLAITGLRFSRGTSTEFHKEHSDLPISIPPGKATPIFLYYIPRDSVRDEGSLEILSNDPNAPQVVVPLLSSIKATPYIETNPQILQFAGAVEGDTVTKVLEIRNIGLAGTTISELIIAGGSSSPYSVLEVEKPGDPSVTRPPYQLDPNEYLRVIMLMRMGSESVDDELIIPWISYTGDEYTRVPMVSGDVTFCAEPNAGVDQIVNPLDTVFLDGSLSFDPNGTIQAYKWEWVEKPVDAHRARIMDSNGIVIEGQWSQEARPNFYAEVAGIYIIQLTVMDEEESCSEVNVDFVRIDAVPASTIHVQLMWSESYNDMDLHLIHPTGHHTRQDASNGGDCHYINCDTNNGLNFMCPPRGCPGPQNAPDWGNQGYRLDDPFLDIDDISGQGPENINLSLPEPGDFKVTVENYSASSSSLSSTVRIWLFGNLEATYQRPAPNFEPQQHWNVCWIRVHDATNIEIIPIDTIE